MSALIQLLAFPVEVPDNMKTDVAKRIVKKVARERGLVYENIGKAIIRANGSVRFELKRSVKLDIERKEHAERLKQDVERSKRRDALAWCD